MSRLWQEEDAGRQGALHTDHFYVLSLQGVAGAKAHNKHRFDDFLTAWEQERACVLCVFVHVCLSICVVVGGGGECLIVLSLPPVFEGRMGVGVGGSGVAGMEAACMTAAVPLADCGVTSASGCSVA